ncbi:MAG TPA: leucyl aminopeptidase [Polyangia bacterium]|jgi:leucyl aminopeptidase|nr:leucyl aminopeptidase [Polyangia bacterium]
MEIKHFTTPLATELANPRTNPATRAELDLLGLVCHDDTLASDPLVQDLDARLSGLVQGTVTEERFLAHAGQTLTLHTRGDLPTRRVALIGAGPSNAFSVGAARLAAGRFARAASAAGARQVGLVLPSTAPADGAADASLRLQAAVEGLLLGLYRFDKYLEPSRRTPAPVLNATFFSPLPPGDADGAIQRAKETARAVAAARSLVNEPAGFMTPRRLAETAEQVARENALEAIVLGRAACQQRGMGLFLAVAQGSAEEPQFIHLAWKPPGARKRVVLIGKGVTFDSGGLSLKTNEGMLDMKVDMSGAAAVLASIEAIARQKLPVEVHALAACTENMPSGTAYKLGDVLRSMNGKTVEITNTDAEGRLTLADAITYGLALKPDLLLDFATLTGACVVALGPHIAGAMGNDDALVGQWLKAAKEAGEEMWPLPLPPRLAEQLKSEIADLKNTGERWGGALTAGLFLKEFVDGTPWVHVDLAGPASTDKELGHVAKGGTGFGVATIVQFVRSLSS